MAEEEKTTPGSNASGAPVIAVTANVAPAAETVEQSFIRVLLAQIGWAFVQGVIALAFTLGLVYKFVTSDVTIPVELYAALVGAIVGYFFKQVASK
ncbi:MAG: hypothetical protein PHV74_00070 [Dehalococcoidia bacterium]|nr:hypothetical protein [Dehalococcoidia bacterium]